MTEKRPNGVAVIVSVVTVVGMVVAISWSPFISQFESIFGMMVTMICYIAPPITATFILGVFWKGASSKGSIATLIVGFVVGVLAFADARGQKEPNASWPLGLVLPALWLKVTSRRPVTWCQSGWAWKSHSMRRRASATFCLPCHRRARSSNEYAPTRTVGAQSACIKI